jgi:serine/threonine-protein kinase RsbW
MTRSYGRLRSRPLSRLPAPSPLDVSAPATAQNATALRRAFRRWVEILVEGEAASDLTLAVYEALANAAEHAFTTRSTPGSIWLHATVTDGQIAITITDNGTWRDPDNPSGHRGRGLPLIHKLTTEAHVERNPRGTTVHLRHQLPHSAPASPCYSGAVGSDQQGSDQQRTPGNLHGRVPPPVSGRRRAQ